MIRVGSTRRPGVGHDPIVDHAPAPVSTGPFRAALRAAGKADPATPRSELAARRKEDPMSTVSTERVAVTAAATAIVSVINLPSCAGGVSAVPSAVAGETTPPTRTDTDPPPAGTPAGLGGSLAALAAALGFAAVAAPTQGTQAAITPVASAPARAGALFAATRDTSAPPAASPVTAIPAGFETMLTMTPLEQAVHDLIGRVIEHETGHLRVAKLDDDHASDASDASLAPFHLLAQAHVASGARDPAAPAAVPARAAAPVQLPEPPANPSHVHLVLDDGAERTVVTVALRGTEVHVAMRSTDDATAAGLARNAASLDHAMRARGLALAELTADREPTDRQPSRDHERRERRAPDAEPFKLEETP